MDLDIPNDALQAFLAIDGDWDSDEDAEAAVMPIVAPAVVAELRRMAALLDESDDARKLLNRADEIEAAL